VRQTVKDFLAPYELRSAVAQVMAYGMAPMDPAPRPVYGTVDLSEGGSPNGSEGQSPEGKETDPSSSLNPGGDKFGGPSEVTYSSSTRRPTKSTRTLQRC